MRTVRTVLPALIAAVALLSIAGAPAFAHKDDHKPAPAAAATTIRGAHAGDMSTPGVMAPHAAGGAADQMAAEERPTTFGGRLVDWLGRWHPSVVHFPIALFVVAGALEAWAVARRRPGMLETTGILVALGALGALAAVALGWMAMGWNLAQDEPLETAHRTLGTAIASLAMASWWANNRFRRRRGRAAGAIYGGLLVATVMAIALNGYLGGALIHGADHLAF
jgi:uncharacterized membrane protein